MLFSLVTCTRGRTNEVAELFDSLLRQNRNDFELILVDQNSDDRLVGIVDQFSECFPLKHIRIRSTGASRARNVGIGYASGLLIGFPDDDCQYLDGYLEVIKNIFTNDMSIGCICSNPTTEYNKQLDSDCSNMQQVLDKVSLLNRCQEFTVFVRRDLLGDHLYNEQLGVGAGSPWGAEEGPDLLIRLVEANVKLVFFPKVFVFHPNKIDVISGATLKRAASYARGRGCLLRLHRFPFKIISNSLFRPAAGCLIHILKMQPKRSLYYFVIFFGTLRGLLLSKSELDAVCKAPNALELQVQPLPMPLLTQNPLVTVLIANYNYEDFIPAALGSLIAQTYSNWQAIVCDDGSTDQSVAIIRRFSMQDPRIKLVTKSNGGQNSAFNRCYREARGEIICLLDADDVFDSKKIERVVDHFQMNSEAGVCNHFSHVIDKAGTRKPIIMHRFLDSGWQANEALKRGGCIYVPTTSCMSIRKEIADKIFPIPSIQDRDLDGYVAMVSQFLTPICVIHEQLSSYRIHAKNMGGLTEPTPQRLRYELHLIKLRTRNVKEFVRQHFGEIFARQIAVEKNPQYIQAALKLHAIERTGVLLPQTVSLIRQHPNSKWRLFWHVIFAAPVWLTRLAIPFMHRSFRIKSFFRRLISGEQVAGI
jgi:glycosyltransferase involved in cell wall biosynthesis